MPRPLVGGARAAPPRAASHTRPPVPVRAGSGTRGAVPLRSSTTSWSHWSSESVGSSRARGRSRSSRGRPNERPITAAVVTSSRASASSRPSRACNASRSAAGKDAAATRTMRPFSRASAPRSRRSRIDLSDEVRVAARPRGEKLRELLAATALRRPLLRARARPRPRAAPARGRRTSAGTACGHRRRGARRSDRGRCDGSAERRQRSAPPRAAAHRAARAWPHPTSGGRRARDTAGAPAPARRRAGRASRTSGAGPRRSPGRARAVPAPGRAPGRAGVARNG